MIVAVVVGRQVPSTASVEGVDVGGLSRDEAVSRLEQQLAGVGTAEIVVTLGTTGRTFTLKPAEAGLSLDIPGTLDGVTGFTLDPVRVWQQLTGTAERRVLTTVDEERLTSTLTARAKESEVAPKDGAVSFANGTATGVAAVTGVTVPVDPLVRQVATAYPRSTALTAEVTTTAPSVTQQEVDAALTSFARPAMSGPVTLVAGTATTTLAPDTFGAALSMAPTAEGGLSPAVDKAKLGALVVEALGSVLPKAQDARIVIENNAPDRRPVRRRRRGRPGGRSRRGHRGAHGCGPDRSAGHHHVSTVAHHCAAHRRSASRSSWRRSTRGSPTTPRGRRTS